MKRSILIGIVSIGILFSCSLRKEKIYTESRISMDTIVTISVVSKSEDKALIAINKVMGEMEKLSTFVDFYSDVSELSAINRNAGKKPVNVSPETIDLVKEAKSVAKLTGGAFDPTIGVISKLWDFNNMIRPDQKDINERLKLVSYNNIIINEEKSTVFLKKTGMLMDLGGIAKGYAADMAVEILSSSGIKSALVSVAGDIRAYGLKPDGNPWMIGIRDPRPVSATENIMAALPLKDLAISTSGDYQRFFETEGTRYHHLLAPQTGMPASGCQSVSVIADRAVMSDALSTAVFIMGPEKGLAFLDKIGYQALIIDFYGQLHISEGLRDNIEIKRPDR